MVIVLERMVGWVSGIGRRLGGGDTLIILALILEWPWKYRMYCMTYVHAMALYHNLLSQMYESRDRRVSDGLPSNRGVGVRAC